MRDRTYHRLSRPEITLLCDAYLTGRQWKIIQSHPA